MHEFSNRKYFIQFVIITVSVIFIIRLFYIQIIEDSYLLSANNNVIRKITIYPPRGLIYDRNGKIIVCNEPIYDLMIIPRQVRKTNSTGISGLLTISEEDYLERFEKAKKYSQFKASIFEKQISVDNYAVIQEGLFEFPGFYVQARTTRQYPFKTASHVLGYIGEVNKKDISESHGYYQQGDYIGINGIEKTYENILRGIKGVNNIVVDVHNSTQGSFKEGKYDTVAVSGKDLKLTIDIELQQYGELLMQNKIGSIVVIEPSTGEILTLISSPAYDPNLLSGSKRGKFYEQLQQDSTKPLFNRPMMAEYPPGSIFKIIMALIGLQEGVLTSSTTFICNKGFTMGRLTIRCHDHEPTVSLKESIQNSCNAYYCEVFKRIINISKYNNIADSYENWRKQIQSFGLGAKLDVDLPNSKPGIVPTASLFNKIYGKNRWKYSNIISLAIGQGELGITPLQMANVTAIIANKGFYYIPHFKKQTGQNSKYSEKHFTAVDSGNYELIIEAMHEVVESGTAAASKIADIPYCGKTGTAQNPHGKDHSVFIAFAPKDNPKIAIAVVVENAGFGSTWAAPISSLLIEKYLTDSISSNRIWVEKRIIESNLLN